MEEKALIWHKKSEAGLAAENNFGERKRKKIHCRRKCCTKTGKCDNA